jgi:hypothetical protein
MVRVDQGTYPLSDSSRTTFPGTLALLINGQQVQSQGVSVSGDYQFTYVPGDNTAESLQISVQVTDSVLYQGSDSASVTVTPVSNSGST